MPGECVDSSPRQRFIAHVPEAPAPFSPPPCLACGACCFSHAEHYVPVTGEDWSRLGAAAEPLVVWNNNKAFMRMQDGHCSALRIESAATGSRFVCSIYDRRPQICRDLARGSPQCEADWSRKPIVHRAEQPRHPMSFNPNGT